MKIICIDNYYRGLYDDILIATNVNKRYGEKIIDLLNTDSRKIYALEEDSYELNKK